MTATPFDKTILHGDLPERDGWQVWAKMNSEGFYTIDSPTLVTPFQPPDSEFNSVGKCATINIVKHLWISWGLSVEQFILEYVAFLNTGKSVDTELTS